MFTPVFLACVAVGFGVRAGVSVLCGIYVVQRAPADEKRKIYAETRFMFCITAEGRALSGLWCRIRDRVMSRTQLEFIFLWANLSLGFSRTISQQGALSACKRVHECIFGGRSSYVAVLLCLPFFLLALSFISTKVASMDSGSDSAATVDVCRSQAKQILKRLNPRSVAKCSIESRPYVFQ